MEGSVIDFSLTRGSRVLERQATLEGGGSALVLTVLSYHRPSTNLPSITALGSLSTTMATVSPTTASLGKAMPSTESDNGNGT